MDQMTKEQNIKHVMSSSRGYADYNPVGQNAGQTEGPLGLVQLPGSQDFTGKVNQHLYDRRLAYIEDNYTPSSLEKGTLRDDYIIPAQAIRFASGEGKGEIYSSVRGHDLFIICDVMNHSVNFKMFGMEVPMGPDDHFQDLVRLILAATGKAKRINVIMPFLYESRQHVRVSRESLDCAYMLKELSHLGVDNIITFDPHDPRVENALPTKSLENIPTSYSLIESFLNHVPDIKLGGPDSLMVVSPDELGMKRATFYASIMELPLGTFYRQRDMSIPGVSRSESIVDYKFLGDSPEGRDVVIIDDMIITGETILETAKRLKEMKAKRVFVLAPFPLMVHGVDAMNKGYEDGIIDRIFSTNLVYRRPELLNAPWYVDVDMSYFVALLIDAINHNTSISKLIDQSEVIKRIINEHNERQAFMDLANQ